MIGVYIVRDAEDNVLYVGASTDIDQRLVNHRANKVEWWDLHHSIERRPAASRFMAFHLERELIRELSPRFNRMSASGAKTLSRAVGPVVKPRPDVLARLIESYGSVAALAAEIGCSHMTLSDIWRGVTYPSSKVIARLVVVTGIPFDELFYVDPGDAPQSEWLSKRPARKAVSA